MAEQLTQEIPTRVTGGCFCGAVRFYFDLPSKWCAHCHCTMCRRIHGAGYVTWVGVNSGQFRFTRDEHVQWYKSSPEARRGFCNECGSSMLFESTRWPGETHIALACLDQPIDRKPQANANYAAHVDWMPVDETLTKILD